MIDISIKTIKHGMHRYPTVGDYFYDNEGCLKVRVSELGDESLEMLVAIHELIEEFLTRKSGIKEEDITEFDKYYEHRRMLGLVDEFSEPGFDSNAPYRNQHAISTGFELILAGILGVDWKRYGEIINSL